MVEELDISTYALRTSSLVGGIGSLLIIITYLLFKQARSYGTTLVFYLSIGDFLHCLFDGLVPLAFTDLAQTDLCRFQAFMLSFSDISSLMWSFCIGVSVFYTLYFGDDLVETRSWPWYHTISWGYSIVASSIPLIFGEYHFLHPTNPGLGCWISDPKSLMRLFLYLPILAVFCFLLAVNVLVFFRYKAKSTEEIRRYIKVMRLYLLAFVASQLPPFMFRLQNFVDPGNPIWVLEMGQVIFHPLQGFFDCLVYGLAEPIFKEQYYLWFNSAWGRISRLFRRDQSPRYTSLNNDNPRQSWYVNYDTAE